MFSRRTLPVLMGLIFLSGMFLLGQDTWELPPKCVENADCDDGNVCTDDACMNGVCYNICNAAGQEDPCCADPVCMGGYLCGPIAVESNLPDTGITKCYGEDAWPIVCPLPAQPFYGQDGQYTSNPMSYTDHGNGTVTDNVTGLMWQRCSAGESGPLCWTGTITRMNWDDAIAYCDGLSLAGYTDWRLADDLELQRLLLYGVELPPSPAIDSDSFPGTRMGDYWTSSADACLVNNAWAVDFYWGGVYSFPKTSTYYVRCVRGATRPPPSFTVNGNGTVTDNVTGLMWQQRDDGIIRKWETALAYCKNLDLGEATDWRLPNAKELQSILDNTRCLPKIDTAVFPGTKWLWTYISSTSLVQPPAGVWAVDFGTGWSGFVNKFNRHSFVRCVR